MPILVPDWARLQQVPVILGLKGCSCDQSSAPVSHISVLLSAAPSELYLFEDLTLPAWEPVKEPTHLMPVSLLPDGKRLTCSVLWSADWNSHKSATVYPRLSATPPPGTCKKPNLASEMFNLQPVTFRYLPAALSFRSGTKPAHTVNKEHFLPRVCLLLTFDKAWKPVKNFHTCYWLGWKTNKDKYCQQIACERTAIVLTLTLFNSS